jgi:hypothetical protein
MNSDNSILILEKLLNSLKVRGFKKTMNLLDVEMPSNFEIHNERDKFIIEMICEAFKYPYDKIKYGRYDRGESKVVIGFIVYYLYEFMSMSEIHKVYLTGRNRTLLGRYRQIILNFNEKSHFDKKYIEMKDYFDQKIADFKNKNL